ncbi:MAG: hypothetical protein M1824_004757 [Vezdaea acicularis]|nr:MAG: hypothetical protein M1824_004757 [Vezdaea acicularis]
MSSLHYYEQDCTGIKPDSCTSAFSKLNLSAEEYYIAWNIYAIATFFTDYWQALETANGLASKKIDAITGVINPPLDTSTPLDSVLLALQAAFSFVILDTKPIEKAIQSSPSVGTVIYPPGSSDSRFIQLGQIKEQLSDLINGYQHNVSDAIANIENDVDIFINFASSGSFNSDLPSMQNQSDTILQALMTMVVSLSLKANKIIVTRSIGIDPRQLEREYADTTYGLAYNLGCQDYNALGMCGPWWYDASTNTTYSLDNLDHMDRDYTDLLGTIFTNYTTPELLFAGASHCHDSILAKTPSPSYDITAIDSAAVTDTPQVTYSVSRHRRDTSTTPGAVQGIDSNGIETSCISAVDVCTYNMTCSPDVYCEFTDCPMQSNFGNAGCPYNADGSLETVNVPFAYLGPWLWGATADTIVCR